MNKQIPEEFNNLIDTYMTFQSGGVEYRGTCVKVFFHPINKVWKAKCQFFNEPTSFFYKPLT